MDSLNVIERSGVFLQLGVGGTSVDFLAAVASYPNPDDKIRTTSLKVCSLPLAMRQRRKFLCFACYVSGIVKICVVYDMLTCSSLALYPVMKIQR